MKRIFSILLLPALLLGVSCSKEIVKEAPVSSEMGTIYITLEGVEASVDTRAADTGEQNSDKTAASTQIFIYDSGGNFVKKVTAAGAVSLSKGVSYTAYALLNGPDLTSPSLSTLNATNLDLATTNHYRAMFGSRVYDLTSSSSASGAITCNHLAARVRLVSVKNNLPAALGTITVNAAYLCNVKGKVQVNGTAVNTWYNVYGRNATNSTSGTTTDPVSSSSTGATWTFKSFTSSNTVATGATNTSTSGFFYCYANSCETAMSDMSAATNASIASTAQATWLTVKGTVGGNTYYWTFNLGAASPNTTGIQANYCYDVTMQINNLGSSNPGTPVTTGTATISVTAGAWSDGGSISATI